MTDRANKLIAPLVTALLLTVGCASSASAQADTPPPPPPAQTDEAAAALLKQIEAASSDLTGLKARVRYIRTQELTGDEQKRFGNFYYAAETDEQPTRFAVQFDRLVVDEKGRPMDTWFIFDGHWLLERDHVDKSATRRELVPEGAQRPGELSMGEGQIPIPLKLKADKVMDAYHATRLPDEPFGQGQTLHHLSLKPRQGADDATPVHLWFDSKTLLLHKVVTTEDTDTVELTFSLHKPNADINPEVFDTALPDESDGWQVQNVPIEG